MRRVLAKIGYGIGLIDDAVSDARAACVADSGRGGVKAISGNLRRAKGTPREPRSSSAGLWASLKDRATNYA